MAHEKMTARATGAMVRRATGQRTSPTVSRVANRVQKSMSEDGKRLTDVIAAIDAANARDPNKLAVGGELGHEQCLVTEPLQDRAPYRIREREENANEQRLVGIGARVEQRHDLRAAACHGPRTIKHSVDSQPID